MPTLINVYGHPESASWKSIEQATRTANGLQTHLSFVLIKTSERVFTEPRCVNVLEADTGQVNNTGLFFYEGEFTNKRLVNELLPHRIHVSCKVDRGLKSPPFGLYLLYQMASAALTLSAGLSNETNDGMIHNPPIGCLWDWWVGPAQRSAAMVAARICPICQTVLNTHGTGRPEDLLGCQQILNYIRRRMMGESPELANRIFIAYGSSEDWKTLCSLLQAWDLRVEHFNSEPMAGVVVTERWRQMLDRARFAFAVMTPDDEMKDGTRQARQNVIHEIGLCHARLGLRSTAILIAEGTEKFSNVEGLTHIAFKPGRLGEVKDEIRKLLEQRGIL